MADTEIYLLDPDFPALMDWIEARVGDLQFVTENPDMAVFHAQAGGDTLPIIIQKDVENNSTLVGVWFNSVHAPWHNDAECARDAASTLGVTVQCDPGDNIKGKAVFLQISVAGEELITLTD